MANAILTELARAYGIRKKGADRVAGIAAVIQSELPDEVWDLVPQRFRRWPLYRNVKRNAVCQVIGILIQDRESFESLKAGHPISESLREMMDGSVAVSFSDGGAPEFVDIVLANIAKHL